MYIIIIGAGRVGYYLARALLDEGHEALIIEKNSSVCETVKDELGSVCIHGDGCEAATLAEAGTDRADMFIAVTGDDEDNLVACQVAKHMFKVPRTIARIRNPKNEMLFKTLGVNVTISSTSIILENIEKEVPTHPITHLMEISDKGLEIVEIKVPAGASVIGKQVKDINLPAGAALSLIIRKDHNPIIPKMTTTIHEDDQIIAVTSSESEEALRTLLRST